MGLTVNNPSFDKVYPMFAYRDNNIRLVLTQGEGATDIGVVFNQDGTVDTEATAETEVVVDHIKVPKFQLQDEQGLIDLTNCEVALALKRPDNSEDLLHCDIEDATNGIVSCPITAAATEIAGQAVGEIRVLSANGIIKFSGVHASIYPGVSDEAAMQSTQFSALVSALQKVALLDPEGQIPVMDAQIYENGVNPVAGGVIYNALAGKASKVGAGDADELVSSTSSGDIQRVGVKVTDNTNQVKNVSSAAGLIPTARAVGEIFEQVKNAVLFKYAVLDSTPDPLPDNSVRLRDAVEPNVIYNYNNGQGVIIPATYGNRQAQYYLGESGVLRYRTRVKVDGVWESWGSSFMTMETEAHKTTTIDSSSTDTQYPSAKAAYDAVEAVYDNVPLFKYVVRSGASSSDTVNLDDATDPRTIYNYNRGQGFIIPATGGTYQTQYYLADDGVLRYRTRTKVNGAWEAWNPNFDIVINEGNLENNLNPYLSPQNKADKYFVRTCIDKSKVKIDKHTQILGFGDSIMATSDGGSWLEILQERVGCPAPYNYGEGNAHFSNNTYARTRFITELNSFFDDAGDPTNPVDASAVDLIVVAGGTNDAKNGSPIDTFKTDVDAFFARLQNGFESMSLDCPPVLVITPIRRGSVTEINAVNNNIEITIAKYSAILNNLALQNGFSVLNGFDIPVLVDDMSIAVGSHTATITSFMLDDTQHVHPNSTTGRSTYAQAVINAVGYGDIDAKADRGRMLADYGIVDAYSIQEIDVLIPDNIDLSITINLQIDNIVDQTYNPDGHYVLYYADHHGVRHNLFDFSVLPMSYTLTAQDKADIADIVLGELPTTQGVLYGNTSN